MYIININISNFYLSIYQKYKIDLMNIHQYKNQQINSHLRREPDVEPDVLI
jgi:hypothetical protein